MHQIIAWLLESLLDVHGCSEWCKGQGWDKQAIPQLHVTCCTIVISSINKSMIAGMPPTRIPRVADSKTRHTTSSVCSTTRCQGRYLECVLQNNRCMRQNLLHHKPDLNQTSVTITAMSCNWSPGITTGKVVTANVAKNY